MKQIWWHITDSYDTEPTQSMRQVMDFITNENEFPIILPFLQSATSGNEGRKNGNFYGLRVFARNSQLRELGYSHFRNYFETCSGSKSVTSCPLKKDGVCNTL